jgi:SpoIID/LytB domain protein
MGEPGGCRGGITWDAGSRIEVDGKQYARGEIKIRPIPGSNNFHVSLAIGLEDYMYGLAEVPPSWHPQALRAQALAGRSYALYRYLQFEDPGLRTQADAGLSTSRQAQCWCHIYATTIDQAYTGWSHESQGNWGRWRDAVDATRRRVITHPTSINTQQTVIQAFYSSSTGGRTENSEDKWVTEVPWLRTKPDGWSQAEVNPHGSWSTIRTPSSFAATLGFSEVSNAEILEVYESGSPKRIRVSGKRNGSDAVEEYTGSQFASRFGLRSHYVWEIDGGFGGGGGGGGGGGSAPTCNGLEATIVGTAGDDVIEGTSGDDVIVARAGDDTIRAKGGDDTICAGAGDDTIAAGGGGDWVNGQAGTDTIDFSASTDPVDVTLKGLVATGQGSDVVKGIENVVGSPGDDRIIGNNKANRLEGGDGDDALRGRGGGDVIIGGPGADDLAGGLGPDRLDGSGGNDLVNYADSGEAVTINLGSGEAAGGEGNDELVSIEAAMASIHDDLLVGSTGEDRLLGLAGDDTIEGRSGNDDLRGNGGTDTINGGNGNDLCRGENLTKCER